MPKRKQWFQRLPPLILAATVVFLVAPLAARADDRAGQTTNFVFFLVDDLGWADLGCSGSTFYESPNIDALCQSGAKFTNAYAACPVCSPTRASILTGRHPVRVDITDWIPGKKLENVENPRFFQVEDRHNLALEEVTLAEVLREHGYQTFFAGKWHLGDRGHWPTDQGFDVNIGGCDKGSPPGGYYSPWKNPNLTANKKDEYLTERLTEESIEFLRTRQTDRPFLLYLSYYNVHAPFTPYRKWLAHFEKKASRLFNDATPFGQEYLVRSRRRQDSAAYASMISAVDDSVGAVLSTLDDLGLTDNTVVIFFSDNGGHCTAPGEGITSNLPLRSGKGWLYEGGVREPMIVRAPGVTRPGGVSHTPVVSMDIFPTMLELAALPLRSDLHVDGTSLLPVLRGDGTISDRPLFWHYPHYHHSRWTPGASIRDGDWKLIEFYHLEKVELYNLRDDPSEQHNLSPRMLAKTDELLGKLHAWQEQLGAKMPQPIP